jgi:hypothetical protein
VRGGGEKDQQHQQTNEQREANQERQNAKTW